MCWEVIAGAAASALFNKAVAPKQPEAQAAAPAPAPLPEPPKPQAPKSPNMFAAANAASAASSGPSSTQLTPAGGIDPALLTLGRNTLLGA